MANRDQVVMVVILGSGPGFIEFNLEVVNVVI